MSNSSKSLPITRRLVINIQYLDTLLRLIDDIPRDGVLKYYVSSDNGIVEEGTATVVAKLKKDELLFIKLSVPVVEDKKTKREPKLKRKDKL